jgi:hypothetical protein
MALGGVLLERLDPGLEVGVLVLRLKVENRADGSLNGSYARTNSSYSPMCCCGQ